MLNTKYPIICAPMNGLSDVKLAVSAANAGILASIVPYTYTGEQFLPMLEQTLIEFRNECPLSSLLVALELREIHNPIIYEMLVKYKVDYIEALDIQSVPLNEFKATLAQSELDGINIVFKILAASAAIKLYNDYNFPLKYVNIKGPEGAGRGLEHINLIDEINKLKSLLPHLKIIASGGISNSSDVKKYIDMGCIGVCMGTLFATCTESSMSIEAKRKIINSSSSDLQKLCKGAKQSALVFSDIEGDDYNNSNSNKLGITTGNTGHVFMGVAIDNVNSIRNMADIVNDLVSEL